MVCIILSLLDSSKAFEVKFNHLGIIGDSPNFLINYHTLGVNSVRAKNS